MVVEQVSHHPPITAYCIENPAKGMILTGHNAQKTSFSGTYASLVTVASSDPYLIRGKHHREAGRPYGADCIVSVWRD